MKKHLLFTLGLLLVIAGILSLVVGKISYTEDRKVLDVGPIEATVSKEREYYIPRSVSIITILVGITLIAIQYKKNS